MVLTQNALVLHTGELDALETGTYQNRPEIHLAGSSMCRSKVSVPKIMKEILLSDETFKNIRDLDEKPPALSSDDMPQFNHFERLQPLKDFGERKYSMSRRTKTKIRQKITAWSRTQRPKHQSIKFIFITLTLTSKQIGTDKDYSKMLNTLFTYLRKYYAFKNYLYVNERQENGNIHTHIIYDRYLPVAVVNRMWCKILKANGYTWTPKGSYTPIVDFPIGKNGANPVDIREIYNTNRVSGYVTKYVTKNESEFDSLIWNCSQPISQLFTSVKIWHDVTFSVLFEHFRTVMKAKLTNGDTLHIHLLSLYHSIQKKHFKINEEVLSGNLDREKFIKQNKTVCNLSQPQQA